MVTSSEDGTVKIWETRSGSVQRSYSHGTAVNDVVIHPNQGEIISCDRGGSVRIWDLAENNCSHQLIPEEDVPVASVTVASDGSTLCAGTNTVRILQYMKESELTKAPGKRIRLASPSIPRKNHPRTHNPLFSPYKLHHPRPPLPRRQAPCNLLSRPHSQNLGSQRPRIHDPSPRTKQRRSQALQVRKHSYRPSTLGMGLCFQCRFCILGNSLLGSLCAVMGIT